MMSDKNDGTFSLPPISAQITNFELTTRSNIDKTPSEITEDVRLPILHDSKRNTDVLSAVSGGDYTTMLERDFLGIPEAFDDPQEALRAALRSIKRNEWQTSTPALINLMQISRFRPDLLDADMALINRSLCSLLGNTRAQIVRTACQVSMELYKTIGYVQRPECDQLAGTLLLKSTHTKKGIRTDAKRALDAMVFHLPVSTTVRILASEHGAGHKNPLIRSTVSSLLKNVVDAIGVDPLLSNRNLKDTRRRIFSMCAKFLVDGNPETRSNAKCLLKSFLDHPDFDTLFHRDVDRTTFDGIKKQLVTLKYH